MRDAEAADPHGCLGKLGFRKEKRKDGVATDLNCNGEVGHQEIWSALQKNGFGGWLRVGKVLAPLQRPFGTTLVFCCFCIKTMLWYFVKTNLFYFWFLFVPLLVFHMIKYDM